MRWIDEITLITQIPSTQRVNENGFPDAYTETRTTVFGNVKYAGFSEFYKAAQTGIEAEMKCDVYEQEYDGQRLVEYEGRRYKVLRRYLNPRRPDEIELTLSDITESQDLEGGGISG